MQHLDEGTLQAWLDGSRSGLDPDERTAIEQHVGACDECAARVDELRSSTERAMSLLGTRAAEGPPPFAAVQARAEKAAAGGAAEPVGRTVREFRWRPASPSRWVRGGGRPISFGGGAVGAGRSRATRR